MLKVFLVAGALASATAFLDSIKTFSSRTNCTDNEFYCGNFDCIPLQKQCDGTPDCIDGSDEHDCEMHECKKPDFFRCKNGRCISSAFVCDSENDCEDFSDEEENCDTFMKNLGNEKNQTCGENLWQCSDKLCIPEEWVCNGDPDCLDGSDETLGCSHTIDCDGFKCKNGHCVFKEWRCDGQDDCNDNSDEENCTVQIDPKNCTIENQHFLCSDGKTCIELSQVCDDKAHCTDKSDEGSFCTKQCDDCSHRCVKLPTGPKCVCPRGYRTINERHCEDINECEIYGICDQKCRNTPGSYHCYCDENYSLQNDKKTCKAHFGEATMYFSSKKEIRAYLLRSEIYFSVAKNLKQVVGVDSDGQYVYWTDIFSEHESIIRALKNGEKKELLVTSGLGAPEDLRIDHVTKNIYFTDAERQHIGVCTNDGSHCTVLVNKDIHKPRGIVLHPWEGEMYWSDWGMRPEIARAYMDGTNDTSFVSNDVHWPNGLTIDYPNSRLYWTDAKLMTLESIHLDGTDRRVILANVIKHPYAIAVFENKLYWSDWATHSIQSCDKFTGKNHHTLIKEQKEYIYGITICHPNTHSKKKINPCEDAKCSDICLLKGGNSYTCACPQDKELSPNKHSCREVDKKQKLLLGGESMLMEVEHKLLGKHEIFALGTVVKKIGALAYNSLQNVVYVSDTDTKKIISIDLHDGTSKPVIWDVGQVTSMDFDYLGNNLYWCDSERKTVEVFNFNTHSRTILIHDMEEERPESITLVPEEGVMFITFQHTHDSHVDRFFMDGTHRTHPIEHGLLGPITVHYDSDLHRIFIADAGTGNIESTSVEGDDRHGFRALQTSPIGITTLKNDIFWVNKNSRNVFWADKYNNGDGDYNKKITLDLPKDIDLMHITSITPKKIGLSPCQNQNGGCSHLCLLSQQRIVCLCPIGLVLSNDNQTCTKRTECTTDEFFCAKSNTCIPKSFRCDGTKTCPNGEDEEDCKKPNHCPLNYYQCQDGECIPDHLRCDFHYDCRDKSDEHNCSHVKTSKCPPKHFQCKNGGCINERLVCDGIKDCLDEEDEANCVLTVCKKNEFRCVSGACIPKNWECDHDYDCPDFSDEHPGCSKCDPSTFTCLNTKCIDKSFLCDGENDCGDNSDELDCDPKCEFTCSGICLPLSAVCNGTSECPQKEDEKTCTGDCHVDEFQCQNGKCIAKEWVCDHSDDCGDDSDEDAQMCNHTMIEPKLQTACRKDQFQCKSGNCIDFPLVCNNQIDCFDHSDEDGFCNTSCNSLNNPCGQICLKTPTGPMCQCEEGYHLLGDGHTCEDIDECSQNNPPVCSQICHNTPGSYLCDCYENFILRNDRTSCKAEGKAMSLIFTSAADNQIRKMSQGDNTLSLVYTSESSKITGMDVSADGAVIYFSVEDAGTLVKINQNQSKTEYIEEVGQPQKLTLDWITSNIYYVNNEPTSKSISLCNFEEKACSSLIPVDLHRQVSAIAVDSSNKYLFYVLESWWMFNSPNYVIYRTDLDGNNRQELVKSTSGFITGLSFDLYKKELYFIDQHQGQLFKINYDGSSKTLLVKNLTRPSGLNFFENQLFFQSGSFMEKCKLYTNVNCDSFRLRSDIFTIAQDSRQPNGENPCRNHTCSHLCVTSKINYKCLCDDGRVISNEDECDTTKREADGDDRRRVLTIHHHEHFTGGTPGPLIAGIIIAVCLLIFGGVFFYVSKKKNSGTFNVISMRFHNPGYGLHHNNDEATKSILQPGQHEYTNPVEFFDADDSIDSEPTSGRNELLVNV